MNRCSAAAPRGSLLLAFASLVAAPLAPGQTQAQDLLVRCQTIVIAPDTVLQGSALLVRQGKVAYVGDEIPAEAKTGAKLVDYGAAVLVPGFVLPPTTLGRERDLAEGALPFTPDLRAVEAFDPWQEELLRLPQHGVTSLLLAPSPRNLAGGLGALVKPGNEAAGGRVVTPELHLALSLAQVSRNPEREPTSLMGAIDALRTALQKAKSGLATGPDAMILRGVLDGSRKATIAADTYPELLGALDLAREFGFQPVLLGATEAHKLMPRLLEQKATVVLQPLRFDQPERQLQLPRLLAEAGVPFCFGGSAESLRLSAVLAVKHGLDRKTALTALTRTPAQTFDQTTQVGALRQGCGADFVVFGGDPLDLGSPHLATWIDGACVHGTMPTVGERPSSATKSQKAAPAAGVR